MNVLGTSKRGMCARAAAIMIAAGAAVAMPLSHAQSFAANGIGRTEVVRHDLDASNEAIQVRVDFAPGAFAPKHSHPGVEIAYVLGGTLEYELNGKTIRLKAGESLFIPAGAVHSAKNVGTGNGTELATYLVEKNKPVVVFDK